MLDTKLEVSPFHLDLWPLESNQFIFEIKWQLVKLWRDSLKADMRYHIEEAKNMLCEATTTLTIDLWQPKSKQWICVSKWAVVPSVKGLLSVPRSIWWHILIIMQFIYLIHHKALHKKWTDLSHILSIQRNLVLINQNLNKHDFFYLASLFFHYYEKGHNNLT